MPIRSITLDLIAFTIFCAGLVYSAGQAVSEIADQNVLRDERRALRAEVAELEDMRERVRSQVDRMVGDQIDADMLDESVRRVFGYGRADEVLLIAPARL